MTRFFTSDLHFGHANIIRYSGRPFRDVDDMNAALVDRWNAVVGVDDTVWVLGDVALGKIADTLPLVGLLHGRKVLIAGNHDRCWAGHSAKHRPERWVVRYLDAGFSAVSQGTVETMVGGRRVLVSHFPYTGDSHDSDRYASHRPTDDGSVLLHGHVHEKWRTNGRQINVGVDVWDYAPVPETTLVSLIENHPKSDC